MKIKTITCHEVYNHGASLQEYALLKYLNNEGHDAETIHYKPPYLSKHFKFNMVSNDFFNKNIFFKIIYLTLKIPRRIINLKRKKQFDLFSEKYINHSNVLYKSNDELKANIPIANAFICGSDQIWNSFFDNGKDPAFYLDFVPDNKLKLSYAASFAIEKLEDEIKDFVKQKVSKLNYISVRESSGKQILENLGFKNVFQVLDPVFLISPSEWSLLSNYKIEKEKYLFIYDFDNNKLMEEMAKSLSKKNGWKIITVNQLINYADKNYFLEGPLKFLSLIKNAEFVMSNSFHAVAFSIIFQKDFVVFNRDMNINTRMRDLLESFGLSHLLLINDESVNNHNLNSINYNEVQPKLNILIEKSKNFLSTALKNQ